MFRRTKSEPTTTTTDDERQSDVIDAQPVRSRDRSDVSDGKREVGSRPMDTQFSRSKERNPRVSDADADAPSRPLGIASYVVTDSLGIRREVPNR